MITCYGALFRATHTRTKMNGIRTIIAAGLVVWRVFAADPSGGISGQVSDLQRKAVADVRMHLTKKGGATRDSKTDDQGRFTFEALDAGEYTVRADSPNFREIVKNVVVTAGQAAHVDMQFAQLAAQRQSIGITA